MVAIHWPDEPGALSDFYEPFPDVPRELWDFDTGLDSADGLEFFMDDLNDEPEQRVNAFVPGIASLANNHQEFANIDRTYSPSPNIDFIATKIVGEGMELVSFIMVLFV